MEILIPLAFFAMIAAIVIVPRYLKSIERQKLQDTLRASIEKGAELPPEVIAALTSDVKRQPSPYRDLRSGVIWLRAAIAPPKPNAMATGAVIASNSKTVTKDQ